MNTRYKKLLTLIIISTSINLSCYSQSEYLNKISKLETTLSQQDFLDTILKIPFDKALSNVNTYLKLTNKAETIALSFNNKEKIALAYSSQSLSHHFTSDYDKAVAYTIKAANLFKELNNIEDFSDSYIDLGWRVNNRDLKKGIYYMNKGIKTLEKHNPISEHLVGGYNNFGILKFRNKEPDSALYYHKKSLQLCQHLKDSIGIPFAQVEMALVYLHKKQIQKAKLLLDEAMSLRKKRKDIYGITDTYLYYGDYYIATKNYKKAINAFNQGLSIATKNTYYPLRQYAINKLVIIYELQKNYKKALSFFKYKQVLKDSVLNQQTNAKISQLEIEFRTSEKEKEIALQKEQILENELEIKNKSVYATLFGSSLLILGVLAIGYYHRSNFKRKQLEKEIQLKDNLAKIKTQNRLQEQRLSISRDLHDNIGSQLTFIISSIDNLQYTSKDLNQTLNNKLTNISSFTSQTIYQLRNTIWAMNKNEISINDFSTRLLSFIEKAKEAVPLITFKYKNDIPSYIKFTSIEGMNLFRVTQEAINNAIKYSEGNLIELNANKKNNKLQLSIKDNGKGFDINNATLGSGLSNMEKRMSNINGSVFINSEKNKGTTITLQIDNTTNDV